MAGLVPATHKRRRRRRNRGGAACARPSDPVLMGPRHKAGDDDDRDDVAFAAPLTPPPAAPSVRPVFRWGSPLLRRHFLAAGAAAALPLPALAQSQPGLYDRILDAYLRESPESATSYGL